ncbi:MAG: hypothetical protein HY013_21160, partial [Candidatus Solibacter usitatus]|nr:hypothetical protein [Candidatus Solibacter usitatus]
ADAVFPLGGRRGEKREVTLSGGNLAQAVKVTVDFNTPAPFVGVRVPGSPGFPILLAVSDLPDMMEPERGPAPLPENTLIDGRISKPGEIDRYRLAVEPGQKWVFELTAAALGTSPLDAILTLTDEAGKKLASGDDLAGADPVLPFTVPTGVREIQVAVEDLLGRGGPQYGYRFLARRQEPDFVADLATPFVNVPAGGTAQVACIIQRRGYDGEIKVRIPNLPPGFHVAGGNVPPESAAQNFNNDNAGRRTARSVLTITADPDVKPLFQELTVVAEAQTPSGVMRRVARGPGLISAIRGDRQRSFTAYWLGMQLPLATAEPVPVTLETPALLRFAQGFEYDFRFRVRRREGARVQGRPNFRQEGAVGNLRILKQGESKDPDSGSYQINTNFATPQTTFDVLLEAQVEHNGQVFTVISPITEVQVVSGYEIQLASSRMELAPGGSAEVAGQVRRELTFEGGEIRIQAEDLPEGVKCAGVVVAAAQRDFTLRCEAGPQAKPGSHEIRIASSAPDTGSKAKAEYKIADVNARLVVTPPASAAIAAPRRDP